MSNYIEYKDRMAFHPGYYIQEELEALEMTQEEFAKRLDTTPKNLSILIRGEQSLSTITSRNLHLLSEAKGGEEWRKNHQM